MKRVIVSLVFFLTSLNTLAELPVTVSLALKKAGIPEQSVAIYVQGVGSDNAILSHNADKCMNPASVMKLLTTNAALDLLTPA